KRAAGTQAGNFVDATTYVGFNAVSDLIYNFQPRANSNANYYLWIKARSKNGQTTVMNVSLDNGTAKQIGCIADTNWVWYRYNLADQTAISYLNLATNVDHQLKITPSNTNLEIDLIHLTVNPSAIYTSPAPCSASAVPTITPSGSTTICQGNSVTLTASSGTSYSWSTGATTQSITVNTAGSYSVTVTSASGTGTSLPTVVTVNAKPTASISASGATTFCTGGSVTLTASGGSSYLWNPGGQTSSSLTVYSSGNYSVNVYSANGCSAMSSTIPVTVNANPTSTITVGGPTSFCQGGNVTLTASSGSSYLWSPGNQTTQSITANASGSYTVRVTNASGCSATSAPTSVNVNSLPTATITPNGPTTFAPGGSVTLTASAGSSYLWSPGNQTTQSIIVNQAGVYTVRVTNSTGCSATSSALTVTVTSSTVPTITASGATTFCNGGSVTLTASAGTSYLWSTGATTQSITASASGSYSVTVVSASGTGTSAPTVITVNPLPSVTATASGATTFCQGGSVTLTSSTGSSYSWTPGGQTTQAINVTASGTYRVTMTNSNGCANISQAVTVTVNPSPTATITASGPTTFNQGGNVTLTASAGSFYLWSPGNQTTQSITVTQGGSYTVRVTNANGCSATSAATVVTVNSATVPTITASGSTTFCNGGTVTLTASAGTSYLWSTGATSRSIVVSNAGSYIVTVTSASGTGTSAPTIVTVNPLPTVTATPSGSTTFCQGGSVTLTSTAGSSYSWTPGGQTTQSLNVTSSGSYRVTMTNSNGCANISQAVTVTVNPSPTATITASGPTTFNQGGNVTLTASAGSSYLWSPGNQTTQSITVTQGGSYTVRVTNGNGCSATSAATVVTVNSVVIPTVTASGSTTFCSGGSVTLTASVGTSYLWSTGATTRTITVTTAGSYSVTVTSASGSGTSLPVTVTVNQLPIVTITPGGSTSLCQGASVTLTSTGGVSFLWSPGGQTTKSINVNTAGNYSVRMTNQYGCSGTSAITPVVVNSNPTATVTASGPTTFNQGGSVTLTAPTNSSYYWFPYGQTTKSITVTQSGNYQVRVTNAAGCSATSNITVVTVIPPANTATITPNGPTTFCSGGTVTLSANTGNSYLWSTGATTKSITVTTSGSYTVTVTSASGSFTSSPTTVTVNSLPTATITANGPTTFCAGLNVRLTAKYNSTYSYKWYPGGQTTRSINVTSSGSYYVVITNSAGCSKQSAKTVVTVTNCGACNPPTVMSTTNITNLSAKLNWNIVSADSFQVRLNNNSTGYQYFSGGLVNTVSSIIIATTASTNYTWWVRAKCGTTFSTYSSANSFTTPALRIIEDSLSVYSTTGFEPMYLAYGGDETTNLLNISSEDEFKLYPNPATDISQLVFQTENSGTLQIKLTDLSGRLVKQINEVYMGGLNVYDLRLDNLPKGLYLVNITTENGNTKSIRLSVQ
ncbi:MAG TPA: T9SS type A sorting domain-containing protein, partial [Bacteroidia bacterium]|nr:T9SS type A sorting domain-containing protein [Bacteroidia bacterium]